MHNLMLKVKSLIRALLLVALLSPGAAAQNQREVFEGVRAFAASSAPGGALENDEARDGGATFGWTDGPELLLIVITVRPTRELASSDFFYASEGMKEPGGSVPGSEVTGLCDENFAKEASDGKSSRLIFRKGVYFVQVFARTRRKTEEAAWNIVTLIPSE